MLPITLLFFNLIFASTDVQNFTDSDFSKSIREKPTFTVFYQQWCSFSTNFIKELETAVNSFSNDSIAFGKIDCAKSQLLCQAYVVGGYPTAKLFQFDLTNGKEVLFDGNRTADGITKWIKLNLLPPFTQVSSEEEISAIKKEHDYTMIGFFPSISSSEFKAFKSSCEHTQTKAARVAVINSSISKPHLVMYHRSEECEEDFNEKKWTEHSLSLFEQSRATPFLEMLNPFNGRRIDGSLLPVLYFFDDPKSSSSSLQKEELIKVSKEVREKMMIAYVDVNRFGRMMKSLGLEERKIPSYAIETIYTSSSSSSSSLDRPPKAHYSVPSPETDSSGVVSSSSLSSFISSFFNNRLSPTIRSQPRPKHQFSPVLKLVGESFEEEVMKKEKDVFVRLVTPWCLTCNRTQPLFNRIANDLKEIKEEEIEEGGKKEKKKKKEEKELADRIVLAEMDTSENDPPPDLVLRGHPTLLLFPGEDKKHPIYCSEWYSYEKMKKFLKNELLKRSFWKGKEKIFPLKVNEDVISDEDEIMEFDKNFDMRKFDYYKPTESSTPTTPLDYNLSNSDNKTDL